MFWSQKFINQMTKICDIMKIIWHYSKVLIFLKFTKILVKTQYMASSVLRNNYPMCFWMFPVDTPFAGWSLRCSISRGHRARCWGRWGWVRGLCWWLHPHRNTQHHSRLNHTHTLIRIISINFMKSSIPSSNCTCISQSRLVTLSKEAT